MRQTTLSVALEVKPESFDHLSALLDRLRDNRSSDPAGGTGPFAEFLTRVPALHFMSLSVFPGYDYDPLFVIEANFDGACGPFWAQLESAIGPELRVMLRCCKRPLDEDGPLFDAVTAPDARAPIAPYLEVRSLTPTVYHHGNRGMTRDRILAEHQLFEASRVELRCANVDGPNPYRVLTPKQIHAKLRGALRPDFAWLDAAAPKRIGLAENIGDFVRLALFVLATVFALSLPGLIVATMLWLGPDIIRGVPNWALYLAALVAVALFVGGGIAKAADPLPGTGVETHFRWYRFLLGKAHLIIGFVLIYLALLAPIAALPVAVLRHISFAHALERSAEILALGLAGALVVLLIVIWWLRMLERHDATQDAPPVDPVMLREMAHREDWIPQNHMGSVVLIKPGILRMILIRAGHRGLGLLLRIIARKGYLGSMRTIHFAHWAMVNNKSRLMFFSNFDQTWESYLDDFIEKAHAGLTLAWSCGVGFPPTRFLVKDGASHGRQFKEWARHSMAVSRFWYSAYKNLTAEQIERNFRIALGLRKRSLSDKEAALWINDL